MVAKISPEQTACADVPLLALCAVSKQFADQCVLERLTLSIQQGEMVALVGASGSGKSTLMKLIMGSEPLTAGEIRLGGKPIAAYPPKPFARQVGMLHQQYDLVKPLSVLDNVLAGRLNHWGFWRSFYSRWVPQDRALAEAALQAVGLAAKIDQPTYALSGGEQQRVAIARLLVQNPQLVLADEPVSALDPANAHNVLSLLTGLARQQGKTLIASLHSVAYAKGYFDRMIGLKAGRILFDLPSDQVSDTLLSTLYGFAKNADHSTAC